MERQQMRYNNTLVIASQYMHAHQVMDGEATTFTPTRTVIVTQSQQCTQIKK